MHPLIPVKIKKLGHFKGELPKYQSAAASGFDIRAQLESTIIIKPRATFRIAEFGFFGVVV